MSETKIPSIDDFENAEHCVLEDPTVQQPALVPAFSHTTQAREIRDEFQIRDKLRGRKTLIRIYKEGWLDLELRCLGTRTRHHRVDLRYLDPVPTMRRHRPKRVLMVSGILGGLAGAAGISALLGWLPTVMAPTAIVAATAALTSLGYAYFASHEKITFKTLHGRAGAMSFVAGLGAIRRFHKIMPQLVDAIADAAESVHEETAIYLRAEMREHYRLRSEGALSEEECAESTGRILGNFEGPL